MKKVIIETPTSDVISLANIDVNKTAIFAKKDGKLYGMVIQEDLYNNKFLLAVDSSGGGFNGYHESIKELIVTTIETSRKNGYEIEFFIED